MTEIPDPFALLPADTPTDRLVRRTCPTHNTWVDRTGIRYTLGAQPSVTLELHGEIYARITP